MSKITWPDTSSAVSSDEQRLRQLEQGLDSRMDSPSRATDSAAVAQAELDAIVRAAGGFPATGTTPSSPPVDPATADLLAPAGTPEPPDAALAKALRDGTIPTYEDQPTDAAGAADATPLDPNIEREAWANLMAFVAQHKDPGTTVVIADIDSFMKGL